MRVYTACVLLLCAVLTVSCGGGRIAQIWTDRGELAFYGEYFNAIQDKYKVAVKYYPSPGAQLARSGYTPDVIVASWLKNSSTEGRFRKLDNMFGAKKISRSVFYPRLLAFGRIDRNQYLLPVSFNAPALIFSKERELPLSNPFTIGFDEIKELSGKYNTTTRSAYTRMGFSPLWNSGFLLTAAVLYGASFREELPLIWDAQALDNSMGLIYQWTNEVNTSNQAEEDFAFKYFFEPPQKLVQSGRILFSYIESGEFFTLGQDSRDRLDLRWIMEQDKLPMTEDAVFLGIPKRGRSPGAARAFARWFFQTDNQRLILEYCKANRISETVFGICGGFSALSPVTEQIYPLYYPELLGRMPPPEYLMPPSVLPENWAAIKERVVLPYLQDRARKESAKDTYTLEKRLADWLRMNR